MFGAAFKGNTNLKFAMITGTFNILQWGFTDFNTMEIFGID
jgi:hypothetical protein